MDIIGYDRVVQQGVPEPGSIAFLLSGIAGAGLLIRRRNRK